MEAADPRVMAECDIPEWNKTYIVKNIKQLQIKQLKSAICTVS